MRGHVALDIKPDEGTVRTALTLASLAPSVHNSQPWRWVLAGDAIELHADRRRWLPSTDPDSTALLVSCGIALHHATLAFAADGWATDVAHVPDPTDPDHLATLRFRPTELDPAVIQLVGAIPSRRSDRRRFGPRRPSAATIDELTRVARRAGAAAAVVDYGRFVGHLSAVGDDILHRDDDPGYLAELDHATWLYTRYATGIPASSRLTGGADDGLNRVFPPGTLADVSDDDAAELVVLGVRSNRPPGTPPDGPVDPVHQAVGAVVTGEACGAVLLEAAALGLSTCVVSRPFERAELRAAVADLLDDDVVPHVLIRVGYCASAQPIPPTPRRPLSELLDRPANRAADTRPRRTR